MPDERAQFAIAENDNTFLVGARSLDDNPRDRQAWHRDVLLDECLEAWRSNPLARRIVELTSQYVVGSGLSLACQHAPTHSFIQAFWHQPLNRMDVRTIEMCDELTRSGNLFILLTTDSAGMSYLRVVPASNISAIEAEPNDVEQSRRFIGKSTLPGEDPVVYAAYDAERDTPDGQGHFAPLMLHYAGLDERINAGIDAYRTALEQAGKDFTIHVYDGVNHAFNNDTSDARYDKAAADLAWERTIGLLAETLG